MSQVVEQHEFKKKHFSRPTWCSFCEKFIWGLGKQGYACKKCSYPCHPKCQIPSLMKTSCPGSHPENPEQDNRPQPHPGQNISSNPIHESPSPNHPSPKPMQKTESLLRFTAGKKEEYPGNIEDYYDMREQIGKGAFSVVKKAVCREDGQVYAVKVINKSNQDLSRLTVEMEILQSVKHTNIIQLKEIYEKDTTLYIITELVTGGELFDRIVKKGHYTEKDAASVIRKLCEAIDYLHNKGIVHRDLKPENLLLKSEDDDTEIKVADFGLSKIVGADNMMQSACGTPAYVAPEILSSAPYTKAVDMWSIGVITYILLCGFPPFYHQHIPILFKAILKADFSYPEEYWSNISDDAIDFIDNLLVRDPDLRMTAKQALAHRWLKNPNRETALNVPGKLQTYNSSYKESFQAFGPTSFDEE